MSNPKWIISNGTGQSAIGNDLNGLLIRKTSNRYELYANIGSVEKTSLPVSFNNVSYDGQTWDITVTDLPSNTNAGTWVTPSQHTLAAKDKDTPPTQGDFTAQTDGTFDDAAASAGHGKH